ncbi:MAG TPA: hypothetical protein ENG05_00095, partial [Acidilobales archaeon]|nr:hypothetical protein [Acidilobales archaeon]
MLVKRGVSVLIAAIFVLMLLAIFFIYITYTMTNFGNLAGRFVEAANKLAEREKTKLTVTYVIANSTGIYIGLRNEGETTAVIKA